MEDFASLRKIKPFIERVDLLAVCKFLMLFNTGSIE